MKDLLEQMIWAWIWDMIQTNHKGKGSTREEIDAMVEEADERLIQPLRMAGVLGIYRYSITKRSGKLVLYVEIDTLGPAWTPSNTTSIEEKLQEESQPTNTTAEKSG
jgi:hypothetical protein